MIKLKIPKDGDVINFEKGKIVSPNFPIIPYILGDGIGVDVTPVMIKVLDFAVKKAYKTKKKIRWSDLVHFFHGEKNWNKEFCKEFKTEISKHALMVITKED